MTKREYMITDTNIREYMASVMDEPCRTFIHNVYTRFHKGLYVKKEGHISDVITSLTIPGINDEKRHFGIKLSYIRKKFKKDIELWMKKGKPDTWRTPNI